MNPRYRLHYAPDNASLVIRLALEELDLPYDTALVDRRAHAQRSVEYLTLNPNGLIPVLQTPQGPLYETAAILLWLTDSHGTMAPQPGNADRADYLKWLFWTSNTLHADLRMLFYPEKFIGSDDADRALLRDRMTPRLQTHLQILEDTAATSPVWLDPNTPTVLTYYIACILRWMALYPHDRDRSWFDLTRYPALRAAMTVLETRPAVATAQTAEGLGPTPFTAPIHPNPPEGSAT